MRPHHNPNPYVLDTHYQAARIMAERMAETRGRAPSLPELQDELWRFWGPATFHSRHYSDEAAKAGIIALRRMRKARRRR